MAKNNPEKPYDSEADTIAHIERVQTLLAEFCDELTIRAECHDDSKLRDPEKATFDEFTPKLKIMEFGSDEYKKALADMQIGLKHHYDHNSHHPEHYPNGINDMSLADLVEMTHDWIASSERQPGKIVNLTMCKERFNISDQLFSIIKNECEARGWPYK